MPHLVSVPQLNDRDVALLRNTAMAKDFSSYFNAIFQLDTLAASQTLYSLLSLMEERRRILTPVRAPLATTLALAR